ncbi:MAG: PEP-utilizing enzyme [Planctomycetota bacterium]
MWLPVTLPLLMTRMLCAEFTRRKLTSTFEQRFLEEIVPRFIYDVQAALAKDLTGLSDAQLWVRCETWQRRTLVDFARESLKPTALALLALGRLDQRLTQFLGSERAGQAARELIMNVPPRKEADLVEALREVAAGRLPQDSFLNCFGHRGRNEMELAEPRWSERITPREVPPVDSQIGTAGFATTNGAEAIEKIWARIAEEAKFAPAVAERIRHEVLALRSWVSLRETAKHYFMHGYAVIRRLLCELDRRFQLDGGIFFLTAAEVPELLRGEKLHRVVETRRRRHRLTSQLQVPAVLFSDNLDSIGQESPVEGASVLQGIPLSPGQAQGPAAVLDEPTNEPLPEPYVLVCPSTDPAWIPLFARATALVMETGGVLSHGAIVAREFGLPAVAGIPGIQHKIKMGQLIRVDGKSGVVTLIDRPQTMDPEIKSGIQAGGSDCKTRKG